MTYTRLMALLIVGAILGNFFPKANASEFSKVHKPISTTGVSTATKNLVQKIRHGNHFKVLKSFNIGSQRHKFLQEQFRLANQSAIGQYPPFIAFVESKRSQPALISMTEPTNMKSTQQMNVAMVEKTDCGMVGKFQETRFHGRRLIIDIQCKRKRLHGKIKAFMFPNSKALKSPFLVAEYNFRQGKVQGHQFFYAHRRLLAHCLIDERVTACTLFRKNKAALTVRLQGGKLGDKINIHNVDVLHDLEKYAWGARFIKKASGLWRSWKGFWEFDSEGPGGT
jgi:hypothetical protein